MHSRLNLIQFAATQVIYSNGASEIPMSKSGTPYQEAVAEIMQAFRNVSEVREGDWVDGPGFRVSTPTAIRLNPRRNSLRLRN
jgi:hypothetical protein